MTADAAHAYSWDTDGHVTGIDAGGANGVCLTYDALGRAVEKGTGAACPISPTTSTEIVYSPAGAKLALMNGASLIKAFIPLPGGAQAVYNASGLQYYRHPDWLGSSRIATTPARASYYDVAYAPYGEPYLGTGTQDLSFTGQNQDTETSTVPGGAGGLYDFLYREHSPVQGRWLSPDPLGSAAADPADPQTWNRYAYAGNRPLTTIDSQGLFEGGPGDPMECDPDDWFDCECDYFCPIDPPIDPGGGGRGSGGGGSGGGGSHTPQRTGGVWPNNQTPGLPTGFGNSPVDASGLLSLSPGTQCGGFIGCDSLGDLSDPFSELPFLSDSSRPPCGLPCKLRVGWIGIVAASTVAWDGIVGECFYTGKITEGTLVKCYYECPDITGVSVEGWKYSTTEEGCKETECRCNLRFP